MEVNLQKVKATIREAVDTRDKLNVLHSRLQTVEDALNKFDDKTKTNDEVLPSLIDKLNELETNIAEKYVSKEEMSNFITDLQSEIETGIINATPRYDDSIKTRLDALEKSISELTQPKIRACEDTQRIPKLILKSKK